MARDSGMSTGPDGGGGGLGGLGGGGSRGGRGTGAGGDNADWNRIQREKNSQSKKFPWDIAQSAPNDGYYSLGDKHYAEKTFAAVTRAQYADWEKRFLPRQRELMELAKNESLAKEQLARTDGLVANSLRQAQLGQDNRMARMGVATKQDSNDNQLGLRQSLITAGTKNATRTHEKDRQLGILTGADAGTREKLQDGGVT